MKQVELPPDSGVLAKLVVLEPGTARTAYPLSSGSFVVGRLASSESREVSIPLGGLNVSRNHARLEAEDSGHFTLTDLNSKNGTYVNGLKIDSVALSEGDIIGIGNYRLLYSEVEAEEERASVDRTSSKRPTDLVAASDSVVELTDEMSDLEIGKTIMVPVEEVIRPVVRETQEEPEPGESGITRLSKKNQMLSVLYQASKALISTSSSDELLETLMDLAFSTVKAQRGLLLMPDGDKKEWSVKKVRYSEDREPDGKITLSRSIASRATKENKAVLINDAMVDPGLKGKESVQLLGIRSAMCVPLTHQNRTLGLLYLDTTKDSTQFRQDDLDVITALGNIAAVAIAQAQLNEELARQEEFRRRMARYHPPAVIERIMAGPANALDVQEAEVTVLFADITDFTTFCEKNEPKMVRDMLNEYFGEMIEVIFKREGSLDKFIADEVLAVFGVPFPHPDDPERALLTALQMREALKKLNAKRPEHLRFKIKTGINTGRVLVGDIGCLRRMDYTVIGGPVNVAKRIETYAQPDQILIGRATYELVKDGRFELEPSGSLKLKGKDEPEQLHELIGMK